MGSMLNLLIWFSVVLSLIGTAHGVNISANEYLGATSNKTALLVLLYLLRRRRRRTNRNVVARRQWVCPTISLRDEQGAWENLVRELREKEPEKFKNFHRMTPQQFDELLEMVAPVIERAHVVRKPISAGLKLSLTLRYLAAGESMVSLAYQYRIGNSTASYIIKETCLAIWDALQPRVLKPPTPEGWAQIAADFGRLWDFPNCVGAIDGKHVVVQCFKNEGSDFFNYKGSHSTAMLAVADAHYRFIYVSIGSKGRESDGGIFKESKFGQAIARETLSLPPPVHFQGISLTLPPVFVGDQAFPLLPQLMRPYPTPGNTQPLPHHRIFNYRLCRARRVVENAFGVLANRFRIYRKPIIASHSTVDAIVQATVVLHNWLRTEDLKRGESRYIIPGMLDQETQDGTIIEGTWRQQPPSTGMIALSASQSRNPSVRAKVVRENFATYFTGVGQVHWQWNHLPFYQQP